MKNIREKLDDSLRREYTRSDFGEMIQGKYATTQLDFAELAGLLLTVSLIEDNLGASLKCVAQAMGCEQQVSVA